MSRSPSSRAKLPKEQRRRIPREIDLRPKPVPPETGSELTADEWEQILGQMKDHGWPEDVVEQIRGDRKEGVTRTYLLRLSDAARYLGLSRYGLVNSSALASFAYPPFARSTAARNPKN